MLWSTPQELKSSNKEARRRAVEKLGESKDPRAVEALIAALKDEDTYVSWKAAKALGEIGDGRAIEPLVAMLMEGPAERREAAVRALDRIAPGWQNSEVAQRAVSTLVVALKDKNLKVRLGSSGSLVGNS